MKKQNLTQFISKIIFIHLKLKIQISFSLKKDKIIRDQMFTFGVLRYTRIHSTSSVISREVMQTNLKLVVEFLHLRRSFILCLEIKYL